MNSSKHYHSLDLFRGFCGYGVAFCHIHAFIYNNTHLEYFSLLFVEFFFVLSGYVLYPQLLRITNHKYNLFIFYQRRWIRTLPLYFICLILVSFFFDQLWSKDFLKYLFFIQKIIPNNVSSDYYFVAWSLSIEEIFYLIFPIFLILFGKKNIFKKILLLFFLILILKFIFCNYTNSNFYRTGTLFRFDAILAGFILRHFQEKLFNFKFYSLFLFIIFIYIFYYSESYIWANQEDYFVKIAFIFLLQLISLLTLSAFLFIEPIMKFRLIKNFSALISKQTYSVYLIHVILIWLLQEIQFVFFNKVFIYILSLFILSTLIYYFIENPLLKKRIKLK